MSDSPLMFDPALLLALRAARHLVVLTGAGISAESGIPTFRSAQTALWGEFDPEEVATPVAFARDPERVWAWHLERRAAMRAAQPNPAHLALAALEQRVPHFTLITQNVDGLHRRAGSQRILAIHGDITQARCPNDGARITDWPDSALPHCSICGALLRPDVVWFGETLPLDLLQRAQDACFECDVFIAIGTSGLVAPASTFPMTARGARALLVEINPEATPLSRHAAHVFRERAARVLPALLAAAWPDEASSSL